MAKRIDFKVHSLVVLAVALFFTLAVVPMFAEDSSADETTYIELVDSESHALGVNPMFKTDMTFSTENPVGETIYILEKSTEIRADRDVFVRISAESGEYNLVISVSTSESGSLGYLSQTGIAVTVGDVPFRAALDTNNHYESYVRDASGAVAVLQPNAMYPLHFFTSSEYRSSEKPAAASGLTFTFSIQPTSGMHKITFVSEGQTVTTKTLAETDELGTLPEVTREGYEFTGWFDSARKQVSEKTKVSDLPSDVITAGWKEVQKRSIAFVSEGKTVDTKVLPATGTLGDFPTVTREGYDLLGWFDSENKQVFETTKVSDLPTDTVTASWTQVQKHTVLFISDGTTVEKRKLSDTDELGTLPEVSKQGYELKGWFDSAGKQVSEKTKVSDLPSYTVTAEWKAIEKRTISFVSDGKTVKTKILLVTDQVGDLPTVEKDGYELKGWFDSAGKEVYDTTKVSELSSNKVEASWIETKRTIVFESDGKVVGTRMFTKEQLVADVPVGPPPEVTKDGYDLTGWIDSAGKTVSESTRISQIPSDGKVTAQWKEKEGITILFVSDGEVVDTRVLKATDKLGPLPEVSMQGYELTGWFDSTGKKVNENTKALQIPSDGRITAEWKEAEKRTIVFVSDGEVVDTRVLAITEKLETLPEISKQGYELTGWTDSNGKKVDENTKVSDIPPDGKVIAQWQEAGKRTIVFVSEGSIVESRTLPVTATLGKLPSVSRSGYEFLGWFDSKGAYVYQTTKVSDLPSDTVTAEWEEIEPEPEPEEWPKITEETYTIQNEDGSVTTVTILRVEQRDGSYTETVTYNTVYPDGSTEESTSEKDVDPDGESDEYTSETRTVQNEDGSTTTVTVDTVTSKDGSYSETETSSTLRPDGSSETDTTYKEVDSEGNVGKSNTKIIITINDDGTETWSTIQSISDPDGSKVASESSQIYDQEGSLIEMDKTTVYTDTAGAQTEIQTVGTLDRMEVIVPTLTSENLELVEDSLTGLAVDKVVVGVHSDTGELVVPQEVVPELVSGNYSISVSTKDTYVALDEDVVSNISSATGEVVLKVEPATDENMSSFQVETVGERFAIVVTLTVDGMPISDLGGRAEISLQPGYKSADVYYVAEDGSEEHIESLYDSETGTVEFEVVHFSLYMVSMDDLGEMLVVIAPLLIIPIVSITFIAARRRREVQ